MSLHCVGGWLSLGKSRGSQIERVCLAVRSGSGPWSIRLEQRNFQRFDHRASDVVLYFENIVEVPVVGLGPEVIAGVRAHELSGDSHVIAGLAHATFEHVRDHESARNGR